MGVRVAYGDRDEIRPAIESNVIPKDTLIVSKEHESMAELFFYDIDGALKPISEKSRFLSFSEASAWAKKYDCRGYVYSIQNGESWKLYVVQEDYSLTAVEGGGGDIDIGDIEKIDGGTPAGLN